MCVSLGTELHSYYEYRIIDMSTKLLETDFPTLNIEALRTQNSLENYKGSISF